ncbi:MAG: Glycosyl phosphatidyl inositol anchor synthesis [Chrysothrix sp. TS-e1954]|nr:MAG: Glycosyl phosphatidyl inositol anchor synthesis [Chrysothrix sp. TS-e1954]
MARLGRNGFLAIAIAFHLVYIYSIFDIYFVSPVVSGMTAFKAESIEAPAQRLVLFVGDGLRADKAFQSFPDPSPGANESAASLRPRPLAPYLRSRVLDHGTFGVSHTRVPTESRPGHVALIAGLYEDVSAVTTGWKLNPVNFDSVFNRSRHTWSWGSPDILPMFKEGATPGRVEAETYGSEAEDFTQDATALDTWVFDKVRDLFREASQNQTLNEYLRKDKNVFFLHLLGLDTTGHAYRPYSKEYLHNIQVVDKGVQEITELMDSFYGDGQTAYVFTADHGMSDWGSHGDGHPDNTRTPLIAWGSGVAKPVQVKTGTARGHEDGFSSDWGLDHVERHDVHQADVAALMAHLAGLEFPVNSVGELPLSYLSANSHAKSQAMLANSRAILEMYRVKDEQKEAAEIRYKPYAPLGDQEHSVTNRLDGVRELIKQSRYEEAVVSCSTLIRLGLEGLRYLQTYDWLFLRTLVTVGFLGWIAFAFTIIIDLHVLNGQTITSRTSGSFAAFSSVFIALSSLLYIQSSAWTYYAYAIFPVLFWEEVYASRHTLLRGWQRLLGHVKSSQEYVSLASRVLACIALLEALVQSYAHREVYTVCYLAAIAWPMFYGKVFVGQNKALIVSWATACVAMSSFTLLPVVKRESVSLILCGGALMFAVGLIYLLYEASLTNRHHAGQRGDGLPLVNDLSRGIIGVQVGLVALAMLVTRSSITSLQARRGLPLGTQAVGWIVLIGSLTVPFLHGLQPNSDYLHRLVIIFLTFSPIFVILTISYEGLFYVSFGFTLITWARLEHRVHTMHTSYPSVKDVQARTMNGHLEPSTIESPVHKTTPYRSLTLADARISLFFLFLLQSAFFSTGNIGSISSFSLDAVYRLIPVFDPFSQGALLLLKLLTPFALISANLAILNKRLKVAPSALFMVVMAACDYMTIRFFYMVRDEGSWLDIGTSISHFVIASLLCVFVAGLEWVGEGLARGVSFEGESQDVAEQMPEKDSATTARLKVNGI